MSVMEQSQQPRLNTTGTTTHLTASGFSFWRWTVSQSTWTMIEDRSESGFEPGKGPAQDGRFDGQIVRWASIPTP
jgi:hypothetical protein